MLGTLMVLLLQDINRIDWMVPPEGSMHGMHGGQKNGDSKGRGLVRLRFDEGCCGGVGHVPLQLIRVVVELGACDRSQRVGPSLGPGDRARLLGLGTCQGVLLGGAA